MNESVMRFLKELEVDEGQTWQQLTIFPVRRTGTSVLTYKVLGRALAERDVVVSERPEASVPELVLTNRGEWPVFVLDGEEVIGGRQNRIANASLLVAAHAELVLPVSCVEHGRWHEESSAFSAGEASFPALRRDKEAQVHRAMRMSARPLTDQGAIWDQLAEKQQQARATTPTGAMDHLYAKRNAPLQDYVKALPPVPGAVGLIVAAGGQVTCADVFDQPATASALWGKLIRSYAMDALDETSPATPISAACARRFLIRAAAAHCQSYTSVGLGEDIRLSGRRFIGSALTYLDTVVHLALFRVDRDTTGEGSELARISQRRRQHMRRMSPPAMSMN